MQFLFPLPRGKGYEFIVVQFDGKEAHFTSLKNFKAHRENSPVCMSLIYFTELLEEKEIVLMLGEYDTDFLVSFLLLRTESAKTAERSATFN